MNKAKQKAESQESKFWEKQDMRKLSIKATKILVWFLGLYASCYFGLETIYFIVSCFYFIFTNLGNRKQGQMSAYSVFNKGFKRLPGTFSAQEMIKGRSSLRQEQSGKIMTQDEQDKAKNIDEYFKNQSKFGNKPCYCGSDLKFKKCCLIKKKQQEEQQRKKKLQQRLKS